MPTPFRKPTLSLEAAEIFHAIVAYVRQFRRFYRNSPDYLTHAASDVMDGWVRRGDKAELDLIRAGLIRRLRCNDYPFTSWELTGYGCQAVSGGRFPRKP